MPFREDASCEVVRRLDESNEGRAFHRPLDAFLDEFGWRSDAVYDLADIPWREDELIALVIAGYVDLDDSEDPEISYRGQ